MPLDIPLTEIILDRGDTALGLGIRGGIDYPHLPVDPGIFVTEIKPGGAAFRDGRLKEGDKIVEVNERNIERVTHNKAIELFKSSGNVVHLKVQCGAEAAILDEMEGRKRSGRKKSKFNLFWFVLGFVTTTGLVYLVYQYMK